MTLSQWYNVNKDARVWAGHSEAHQQGWMYAPAAILAIEEYKGSVCFEEWRVVGEGVADFGADSDYPNLWMQLEDLSLEPYEEPVGDPEPDPIVDVDDEALGAAFRLLVNLILGK